MRWLRVLFIAVSVLFAGEVNGGFEWSKYSKILSEYVDSNGMVDYKGLKENRREVDEFVVSLGGVDKKEYEVWDENEKIAFWINAYNGLTLRAIIDNYPIKANWVSSLKYPKNSIRQISGVWDKLKFEVMGEKVTLSHIEHGILRKKFKEPRIHMALVCAAMGCPTLRNESYTGVKLDEQLDGQGRKFFSDPNKFVLDHAKQTIYISPIFKWFGKDFITTTQKNANKNIAINFFVRKYLDKSSPFFADRKWIYKIKFLDYDWSLNEQRKNSDGK